MKDYYNLFVALALQQCKKEDYADKSKVKANNAAMTKQRKLRSEIQRNGKEEVLSTLLNHEDDRVQLSAAAACLDLNVYVEQAILTLKRISKASNDPTFRFSAKMLLKQHGDDSVAF